MKVFITGAGGYIGSKMVEEFLEEGNRVVALDRFFFGDVLDHLKKKKNLHIVKDDTRLFSKSLLKGVDVVIDLASLSNDPATDLDHKIAKSINVTGSVRVAKLARELGVSKIYHLFLM